MVEMNPQAGGGQAKTEAVGEPNARDFEQRRKKFQSLGILVCVLFLVVFVVAATLIEIGGAVTAPGLIQQTGENKSVQHPEGGAVSEILVKNGDLVNEGDTIVRLSGTRIESEYRILNARQFELRARRARLEALDNEADSFEYPIPEALRDEPFVIESVVTQEAVFRSARHRMLTARERINARVRGLKTELGAQARQISTMRRQLEILDTEIVEVSDLLAEQLVSKARLTALQRQQVGVEAEIDGLRLAQSRTRNALSDSDNELDVLNRETKERLWREIEETKTELEQVERELEAATDRMSRLVISAPAAGRVHELGVNNTNAVIGPRETIAEIVPADAKPVLSARIGPLDIDQVALGQAVRVRFDTLDRHDTPEIEGVVANVSPDSITDEETGEMYYTVMVELPADQLGRVDATQIIPGLPASAMFATGERTLIDYLTKPLRKQMFSAFRED